MDDDVIKALARWPDVPHVYGWLSLDRRGQWRLQDSPVTNPRINEFIGRNYAADERGAWFFQNGPQRAYVTLAYTPWVLRSAEQERLVTHTGLPVERMREALLDEDGNLLIAFAQGVGVVDDRDLPLMLDRIDGSAQAIEEMLSGKPGALSLRWQGECIPLGPIRRDNVAPRYGFVAEPQPT